MDADAYTMVLEERLAALEMALESDGWRLLAGGSDQEFSRQGLGQISELARVFYLKNPIIQRSVDVKRLYVWGQGWMVKAADPEIQIVLDSFLYDTKNIDVVGSHEARQQLEIELQTDGNLFFAFFVNQVTGRVRVRTIPFADVQEVIYNPDDAKEPWYYKRVWAETRYDMGNGIPATVQRVAYYPDWRYSPTAKEQSIGGAPIRWDVPVYHIKVGGFSNWRFGVPEVYDTLDWARAYKEFLEDWASITRAYRRFAFQLTTPGGKTAVAAAKAKLNTGLASGTETNPAPIPGSTFIASDGANLQPVRTSGATVSAEDGRRLLLMVAAGSGLPETFFGDAAVGTLATAKSLDRPTELQFSDRQQLWRDIFLGMFDYVLAWAVRAPQGALRSLGRIERIVEDGQYEETLLWRDGVDGQVGVSFPPLIEHDIPAMVNATVQAATLGMAGAMAGTFDLPTLSGILLNLLGIDGADEILARLFPDGQVPEEGESERPAAESLMVDAVRDLRDALTSLQENGNAVS